MKVTWLLEKSKMLYKHNTWDQHTKIPRIVMKSNSEILMTAMFCDFTYFRIL